MNGEGNTLLDTLRIRTSPVHLWEARGRVTTWSADTLRTQTAAWAAALVSRGVRQGDVVATCASTSLELLGAICGAWHAGAAVLVLPNLAKADARSQSRVKEGIALASPAVVVHDGSVDSIPGLGEIQRLDVRGTAAVPSSQGSPWRDHAVDPDGLALLQLTSGTSGRAKAVPITHAMLLANCRSVKERIGVGPSDHIVSWLPLTHDMGFSGAIGQGLLSDCALTLLPTECFVRSPIGFLQAMSDQRGTLSPNPASAYDVLSRLGPRARREDLDLSNWRYAWAGAEPVFAHVLEAFERAMEPMALRPAVLQPSYGLAEAVLAVSFSEPGKAWRALHVEKHALREHGIVVPADAPHGGERLAMMARADGHGVVTGHERVVAIVSNGAPLPDMAVQVRDAEGSALPEGHLGVLWVAGPSVADGYLGGVEPHRFVDGWYDTGDIGFLWTGEVYVTGRAKDLIVRGGAKLGAAEVESVAERALDLRSGRVAVFADLDHAAGRERIVMVITRRFGGEEGEVERKVREAVVRECGIRIDEFAFTGSGSLPRTTSGKLQRSEVRACWQRGDYMQKELEDCVGE
ncbi:MAG: AMP-binding protein [bacterium]|jgi:acyl-CoA synthetase (AMP-forming)/AMP-acid ligase II